MDTASMPKTSVHKDNCPVTQQNVGVAVQFGVEPMPYFVSLKMVVQQHFRRRPLAPYP